ncbi:MAG: hypothetical protein DMF89_21865 [Acidobacteria bacterium]|nr:MAG: hypothetical protein DMF89_21865 [Acidobacteriota bacterium]
MLLGVLNGLIDLHSGSLRAGRPEDRITMRCPVAFDEAASCPRLCPLLDGPGRQHARSAPTSNRTNSPAPVGPDR